MSASALIGQAVKLLGQVPVSTLAAVVDVIKALVSGDSGKAERLAKNAALAIAAKRAAAERIRLQKGR
jgi:hypothetical protein